jgi:hypothetical protein
MIPGTVVRYVHIYDKYEPHGELDDDMLLINHIDIYIDLLVCMMGRPE